MTSRFLPATLRQALASAILTARIAAEAGAEDAIRRLGVADARAPAHLDEAGQAARRRLRAHARTLGDEAAVDGTHSVTHLVEAAAYAQWHRRLFARFLAERQLLRHPVHKAPVTLEDVEELAAEEGFADGWSAAESYASRMLPAVFQPDDPVLALALAPEHAQPLRKLVLGLDPEIFRADDSLGWTYQFWRTAEKKRVNDSQVKIGAAELPAVTQLFTEPYMVRFLLHNTLGAWRAGKILAARPDLAAGAPDEDALRAAVALPGYEFDMLRFVKEGVDAPRWRPAGGTYPGWPTEAAKITVIDPCCGSGHFLTEALTILADVRSQEEGLTPADAVAAVLKDNLFGLEIDGRCVQIAAFAVALTAWRIGGFQTLPAPHIAWVGAPPPLQKPEFVALANGQKDLRDGLDKLWDVFVHAPLLGSLIDPTEGDLTSPQRLGRIAPLLEQLVERTRAAEPARSEGAVAAKGMADAAGQLARRYTLAITNVPFLGGGKQDLDLAKHISKADRDLEGGDLAIAMFSRVFGLLIQGGSVAAVTPQSWLFLVGYKPFRARILNRVTLNVVGALGPRAFETITGEVVNTALVSCSVAIPDQSSTFASLDANEARRPIDKAKEIRTGEARVLGQLKQLRNPDHVIAVIDQLGGELLRKHAWCYQGTSTGDNERCVQRFWEQQPGFAEDSWEYFASPPARTGNFGGASLIVNWRTIEGRSTQPAVRGFEAWGKRGLLFGQNKSLPAVFYTGARFSNSSPVLIPNDKSNLPAVSAFVFSGALGAAVRSGNRKLSIDNGYIGKVPFDLRHWRQVAAERYPHGLPDPQSDDPTEWLFHGHPAQADVGTAVHVALARLAGYRWPAENDPDMRLSTEARDWIAKAQTLPESDSDGILTVVAGGGDRALAERLRAYLASAFGDRWDEVLERQLVAESDIRLDKRAAKDGSLETWLRDRAFRQHCKLFHDSPFLWQVWDGRPDGFSVFLHYHRLDNGTLQKLVYSVLGDWIRRRKDEGDEPRQEVAQILQSKLVAILEGEQPFDIFVRWKSLANQPLGWNPDLNDGVRLNTRPWVKAGVLRHTPQFTWGVDRGKDVASAPWFNVDQGKRNNDRHSTLAEKRAARAETRKTVDA